MLNAVRVCLLLLGLFFFSGCSESREDKYLRLKEEIAEIEGKLNEIMKEDGMTERMQTPSYNPLLGQQWYNEPTDRFYSDPRVEKLKAEKRVKERTVLALEKT